MDYYIIRTITYLSADSKLAQRLKDIADTITEGAIGQLLRTIIEALSGLFGSGIVSITQIGMNIFNDVPFITNVIRYSQALALSILAIKVINESLQTYILYQSGDPDADPGGLLIRTLQAVVIIAALPDMVKRLFVFGMKVANDIAITDAASVNNFVETITTTAMLPINVLIVIIFFLVAIICVLVQAAIRSAELAVATVVGPILALNISSTNRSTWSMWFKQVLVITTTQAIQIFMLQAFVSMTLSTNYLESMVGIGLLRSVAWLWVTLKTPKWLQQFTYASGAGSLVGATARQFGSTYFMRKAVARK